MNSLKTVFLLLPVWLSGCGLNTANEPSVNYYYLNPHKDLRSIGRTAFVELANDSSFPQMSADVTEALFQAMQKKQNFSLTIVRQNDPAWRSLQFDMNKTYALEQLSAMRKTLQSDALLVGTITGFQPYPHMLIGLRLKLIDLTDGQLLWALEQIWDTTDKTTEDRIKNYYSRGIFAGCDSMEEKLGTISSLKFIKFVAYEAAEALQPKK